MSEDIRVFLAMIATCPAIALFIVGLASLDSVFDDLREGFGVWVLLSGGLITLVSAGFGLISVWTWAV